jgi:multicomponent Na+:H+ antiporter subunit B
VWHTTEPVNEIVYGTRGFDTFGETFLLLAAVVSVATMTRRRERRTGFVGEQRAGEREQARTDPAEAAPDPQEVESRRAERREQDAGRPATPDRTEVGTKGSETAAGMTVLVRSGVRAASLLLAVAGLYLVAWGYTPGGGFPAGAVVLGVVLLLYAGFGHRRVEPAVRPDRVEPVELAGAIAIILIGLLGLVLDGSFLASWLPVGTEQTIRGGGILQLFSGSELVEVGTGLTLAVFGLLGMRHDWAPDLPDDQSPAGPDRPGGSP